MAFPTVGQRSFLLAPQLATIAEKTMISVSTFAVFMITKFDYKENENLGNLWPVIDEVYHLSVNPPQNPAVIERNKQKLKSKFAGKKLPNFDDQLRAKWGEWYIPAKTLLNGMEKFKAKLPSFHAARAIGFGTALEQCTSESLALWKAIKFPAKTVVSLTGGLGVDDWAWASRGADVHSFEIQPQLNLWSCINFEKLGVSHKITRYSNPAEEALENWNFCNPNVDIIYIDPDRRPAAQSGQRVTAAVDLYSPNVFELYAHHQHKAKLWLIKLSPMVDIHWFQTQINQPIQAFALCAGKEVKEVFIALAGSESLNISANTIAQGGIEKNMVHIGDETHDFYGFTPTWNNQSIPVNSGIIYEPHAGLFCLGLQRNISTRWGFESLGNDSFFLSPEILPKWLGRSLEIEVIFEGSLREIGRKLKENQLDNITITARNCGMATLALVQKLGTKENSKLHGFIFKSQDTFTLYVGKVA